MWLRGCGSCRLRNLFDPRRDCGADPTHGTSGRHLLGVLPLHAYIARFSGIDFSTSSKFIVLGLLLFGMCTKNSHVANVGIEPKTFALLARRSNQLS